MRTARRSSSSYDGLASALRAFVARRAQELIGLSLLAVAGLVAASLATWSVDDPSLNNATDSRVRNATRLARRDRRRSCDADPRPRLDRRTAAAGGLGMALDEIGRARTPPAPARTLGHRRGRRDRAWPAPCRRPIAGPCRRGLGGVVGDAILAAAKAITGMSSGPARRRPGHRLRGPGDPHLERRLRPGPVGRAASRRGRGFRRQRSRPSAKAKQIADWDERTT